MNSILSGLVGAAIIVVAYGLYWTFSQFRQLVSGVTTVIADLSKQVNTMVRTSSALIGSNKRVFEALAKSDTHSADLQKVLLATTEAADKVAGEMVKSNQHLFEALNKFSGELEFLRTVMTAGTPEALPGEPENPAAPQRQRSGPIPSFPQWQPFVAAVDVPDAEESDTVVTDTTDAEFLEQEQIETIRGQGFAAGPEADPTENPPGVTANV